MSRTIFVPDTNFFLNYPDFVSFFSPARSAVHLKVVWPVLWELDYNRKKRFSVHQHEKEKGQKAYQAFAQITQLLNCSTSDLDLEVYGPERGRSPLDPDAEIVDCVVRLATLQHANDAIEFITDDGGIPTVLFIQEKKRNGLENVTLRTAEEVKRRISAYGSPGAVLENLSVSPRPQTVAEQRGIQMYLDCLVSDLKGQQVQVGIYDSKKSQPIASDTFDVPTSTHMQPRLALFLPYSALGVAPKRHGMEHVKISAIAWNLAAKKQLTCLDSYRIDLALGGHFLIKA